MLEVPMFRRTLAVVTGLSMVSVDVHAPAGHRLARSLVGANGKLNRASQRSCQGQRPHGHGASARSPDSIRSSRPRSRGKRGPSRGPNVCSCLGASGATRRVAPDAPRQVQLSGWVIWACHTQTSPLHGYKRRLCRTGEGGCIFSKCSGPVGFLADHDALVVEAGLCGGLACGITPTSIRNIKTEQWAGALLRC